MNDLATPVVSSAVVQRPPCDTGAPPFDGRRLRVVLVDEELPYPPNSGKRIRTLSLMTRLARCHQLTYLCHQNVDASEVKPAVAYLADHGIASVVVKRRVPPKAGIGFYARLGANLLSPLPYSVTSHTSRQMRHALESYAAQNPVDLWQCEWTPYAEVLRSVPGPRIVHTQNVEAAIWRRYYETEENAMRRWYIKQQWLKFQRFERTALASAHRTIAVSELDAQVFRSAYGVRRVDVVENGVDTAYFRPRGQARNPKHLLFLGSLDWRPNLDGVDLLLDTVFPAVRAAEPDARLVIVGRKPPAALRAKVAGRAGVELHANVGDVRPYLASCGSLVVPLRIGGGSRLKILEALASALPVLSTRIGAEGLELDADKHLTVVETIADMAPAILAGMQQPAAQAQQAARGCRAVAAAYDWDRLAARLDRVWAGCLTTPTG